MPRHVVTANTLMLLAAEHDAELREILEQSALSVPESSGIAWAFRRLGVPIDCMVPGIDLMVGLCEMAAKGRHSVFLLGSAPGVVEQAAEVLTKKFSSLRIVGMHHGYFSTQEEEMIVAKVRASRPDFLFVGMGMPAQEKWIARYLGGLCAHVVMGVGGSFDVLSGRLKRAPKWMRKAGIEWGYRLLQEPWRWRRIAQLPVFAWKVWKASLQIRCP